VLVANHKPIVRGTDDAIWRRVRLIPWTEQIAPSEQRDQVDVLAELASPAGRTEILNWLLDGLDDRMANPRWIAPEVLAATVAYREEQNALGPFLTERCELAPRVSVPVGELYEAYEQWAEENGEEPVRKRRFNDFLRTDKGLSQYQASTGTRQRRWAGIRLL